MLRSRVNYPKDMLAWFGWGLGDSGYRLIGHHKKGLNGDIVGVSVCPSIVHVSSLK